MRWILICAMAIVMQSVSVPAHADACSGLGSGAEIGDLIKCLKSLNRDVENLERENQSLRREVDRLERQSDDGARKTQKAIDRLEQTTETSAQARFRLQCQRSYGNCAYGRVHLSQPGSDTGVCCSVTEKR